MAISQGSSNEPLAQDGQLNQDLIGLQKSFFSHLQSKGRSTNTLKNYRTDIECFNSYLKREKAKISLGALDIPYVQQYCAYLQTRYNSDNSRRRRVQALRLFFDFLVQGNVVASNPVRNIPTSPKFLDKPRPAPFIDLKTLWQYLLEEGNSKSPMTRLLARRNQVIFLLIYSGALKVSDLSKLKTKHIYLPQNEDEDPRVLVTPPKRDPYTVPLCQAFVPVYEEYREELNSQREENNLSFEEVLFNANPYRILAGGLSARGIEIIFEDWRGKLMVEVTPKSLRQACIFSWLSQKHGDGIIKEWMGVAPSYSLKLYRDHLPQHAYTNQFLMELYYHYKKKHYART